MGNCRDGVGTGTEVVTMGTVVVGTWMEIGIEDIWERGGNGYSVYGDGRGWGLISLPCRPLILVLIVVLITSVVCVCTLSIRSLLPSGGSIFQSCWSCSTR